MCCGDDFLLQKCVFDGVKWKLNIRRLQKAARLHACYVHLRSFWFCVILWKKKTQVSACINFQWLHYRRIWHGKNMRPELLPCKRKMSVCLTVSGIGWGKRRPGENKDTVCDLKCFAATRTEYLLNHTQSPLWGFEGSGAVKLNSTITFLFYLTEKE